MCQTQWLEIVNRFLHPVSGKVPANPQESEVSTPSKAQRFAMSLFTIHPLLRAWPGDDHMDNPPRPVSSKKARCSKLSFLPSSKANYFGAIDLSKRQQRKQLQHKVAASTAAQRPSPAQSSHSRQCSKLGGRI